MLGILAMWGTCVEPSCVQRFLSPKGPDHLAGAHTKEVVSMDEQLTGRLLYNSGLRIVYLPNSLR
jgi:hypothetical protein